MAARLAWVCGSMLFAKKRAEATRPVLLIDYLHPLRIFYDFDEHRLLRLDLIPIWGTPCGPGHRTC